MFRLTLALLFSLGLCLPTFAQAPKKYALLIAVTTYEHTHLNQPPIQYPEADATAIGDQLKASGYVVELLLGEKATKAAIDQSLANLAKQGNAPGVILIGVFGHGVEYDETTAAGESTSRSYFCPYDATMRNRLGSDGKPSNIAANKPRIEPDPTTLISMGQVFSAMALSPAGNRVLLADCCRNDPHAPRGAKRGFGTGIKSGDLPENANTAALFACSKGEQAWEDPTSKHGAFTKCVLDWLAEPMGRTTAGRLGEHLDEAVPQLVKDLSMGDQVQQPKYLSVNTVNLQLAALTPVKPMPPMKPMPPARLPKSSETSEVFGAGTKAGDTREITLPGGVKLKQVWCPPGTFTMGTPGATNDEAPVQVTLPGYWLAATETTQSQYTAVMGTTPWVEHGDTDYYKTGPNFPASYITHTEAEAYCAKLTEIERKAGRLPTGWKYALPTEAQWEYACRAGTKTAYSFGDDGSQLGEYAWFDKNALDISEKYAHTVEAKKSNAWGLFDMHGNVYEWCADWYGDKLVGGTNPGGPSTGSNRVFRGGGWFSSAGICRSAYRGRIVPSDRDYDLGFRVCLSSD